MLAPKLFPLLGMLLIGTLSSCNQPSKTPDTCGVLRCSPAPVCLTPADPSSLTVTEKKLYTANQKVAFKLFNQAYLKHGLGNVLVSPLSFGVAFQMLYNGTGTQTALDMKAALELQDLTLEEVNTSNTALTNSLTNYSGTCTELRIANAVWAGKKYPIQPTFLKTTAAAYRAEAKNVDFATPDAAKQINEWAATNTNGKITKVLETTDPKDAFYLTNALYFLGSWSKGYEFDPKNTQTATFTLSPNSPNPIKTVQVPMMQKVGSYKYFEDPEFQAVALPYGNGRIEMQVYLPIINPTRSDIPLGRLVNLLSSDNWNGWQARFNTAQINLKMPKFKLEYKLDLKKPLENMGMGIVMNPDKADLKKLVDLSSSGDNVSVTVALQKTFIKVDEVGTEAAAVTVIGGTPTAAPMPTAMNIDHPFFYVIRDTVTGSILFSGIVQNPLEEKTGDAD
jgi:serine protease inhibitor